MKKYSFYLISLFIFLSISGYGQFCGIKDPSMERYGSCPNSLSQLYSKSYHWFNVLNPSIASSDYFHEGDSCNFGGFSAGGGIKVSYCTSCFPNGCSNTFYEGCGRAGLFLNYFDGSQDPKYKEYIGTRVDLVRARSYTISIDVQRSNDSSSNIVERDICIYGYSGPLPAAQFRYCPTGAVALDTISKSFFDDDSIHTINSQFLCSANYNYLLIGPVCDAADATAIGYVYLDKILLSDAGDSTLTPWIKFGGKDSRSCCFSGTKSEFQLVGNAAPSGTAVLWSQNPANPELFTLNNPNDSITGISGTGLCTAGTYQFYYTWTKYGCTMMDTLNLNIVNNARANAGPDIVVCNGNLINLNAPSPSISEITNRAYSSWWSIVDPSKPGGIYTFPLLDPYKQNCSSGPEPISYAFGYVRNGTNLPAITIKSLHQADTFKFIWNILDDCNNYSSDTVTTYSFQLQLSYDSAKICLGDTSGLIFENRSVAYNSHRVNRTPLYYTWSILGDTSRAELVGDIHGTSIRLTSTQPGYDTIIVDVYDSTNALCSHYFDTVYIYVKDTLKIFHPADIFTCGQSSRFAVVQGGVPQATEWWWDVIDYSQPDSLFTLRNPKFPLLPYDGDSNRNVRYPTIINALPPIPLDSISTFVFTFLNPQDTFIIIYNVRNSCYPYDVRKDTIRVITNHVEILGGPTITCPGDTSIILFETGYPVLMNNPNDTSLHYYWHQVSGAGLMTFDTMNTRDSIVCNVENIPGTYTAELILYDSDDSLCPVMNSSFTFDIISPNVLDSVNAGASFKVCNGNLSSYSIIMNARPTIRTINTLGNESWWSVIDYAQPDSEFTFNNGCHPGDGLNNGSVSCRYDSICGEVTSLASEAPNCMFTFTRWGCYDFIWHVRFLCYGIEYFRKDTMRFCWEYLEPFANAGIDDTAKCNVFQLIGNTSSSSAANNGCFHWRQIRSTTGVRIQIADSSNNISYLLGLDTVAQGTYYFEFTLGCGSCVKKDTIAVFVPGSLPQPSISLSSSASDQYICKGDSIIFIASGADQYQFFINNVSASTLSTNNIFVNKFWLKDTNIVSVIAYDADLDCYSAADTSLRFIFNSLDSLQINSDSIVYCAGSQTFLIGRSPYPSQRIFWFNDIDSFRTPINLPNGTAVGDSISVAPIVPTLYRATLYDTLSMCWSDDTLSVLVYPVVVPIPSPRLQNDTTICTVDDSIDFQLSVINQNYPGIWSSTGTASIRFAQITNPLSLVNAHLGNHLIIWIENNIGCIASDTFELKVIASPSVNAGNDTAICITKQVQLSGNGTAQNYHWIPMDSVLDATALSTLSRDVYSSYYLILEGNNELCTNRDTLKIIALDCPPDIKAPTAFSPNGDGNNDFFTVFAYQMKTYEISIFDRWGEKVYSSNLIDETNDLSKGWDGKYKGRDAELGVYVYIIRGINRNNEVQELKGNLTLVR